MLIRDRQLKPVNTCSTGKLQFNAFSERLDIPLPCRLVREGFPYVSLKEQQRMVSHPVQQYQATLANME